MNPHALEMGWLPVLPEWDERVSGLEKTADLPVWEKLVSLAKARLDFASTLRLDRVLRRRFADAPPVGLETRPVRLSILGSSTVEHLFSGLRVGALRHGLWLQTHTVDYGQYLHAVLDPTSSLHQFKPDTILLVLDTPHLFGDGKSLTDKTSAEAQLNAACERVRDLWRKVKTTLGSAVIQQTLLPVALTLMGSNEHCLPGSTLRLVRRLNERLRLHAEEDGVDILAIDESASYDGLEAWHDPALWHRAKQEINPLAAPFYGELVARILAARQGRSKKCLVLDLDHTLWGGVIGDDGLEGIKLGQGSTVGEAYLAIQTYARDLSRRGIVLAVCSKNDEATALAPFQSHPEMVLRRSDFACFVANWQDKATNLRHIAQTLRIGLDALVFLDDNPFERDLVRGELPMVSVPELPDDPALYPRRLAEAGYFEAVSITTDDANRARQYEANIARETLLATETDLESHLRGLRMELVCSPFTGVDLHRIVQLINKTNQFNLTTRRYTEMEITTLLNDPRNLTFQLRLIDRLGDNGIIGIVIGRPGETEEDGEIVLDTWLMSCRVLGRGVEQATLNLVAQEAIRRGARRLRGVYLATSRNGMVQQHYPQLGFKESPPRTAGAHEWMLTLDTFTPFDLWMTVRKMEI